MSDQESPVSIEEPGNVVELFAGVGGFRLGLEGGPGSQDRAKDWRVVWSNQWEPSTKRQDASSCYVARFGSDGHSAVDIAKALDWRLDRKPATAGELATVPALPRRIDLLVGGFPCQDYSVAKSLSQSTGITGQKGVLWWEIRRFLAPRAKGRQQGQVTERTVSRPQYVLLENVDRLLKSPASQRGRDFAIMLATLHLDGYDVQWRVIDASEYGFPQRRKRVFILAEKRRGRRKPLTPEQARVVMRSEGTLARTLPVEHELENFRRVERFVTPTGPEDVARISNEFNLGASTSPFGNIGVMRGGVVHTARATASYEPPADARTTLGSILLQPHEVPPGYFDDYYIPAARQKDWDDLKGAKRIDRVSMRFGTEHRYTYSEGAITYPDALDRASRTILTGEGGTTPSRFKHVVDIEGETDPDRKRRRLTPIELERLQGFPDDWTRLREDGSIITDGRRAFFMGNALVVGVVERIGRELAKDRRDGRHTFGL
jgi:DNA (cytosine-5)-methyltransferase 1